MLTKGETNGIIELLIRLDEDVIYSLANTATKKTIKFSSIKGEIRINLSI